MHCLGVSELKKNIAFIWDEEKQAAFSDFLQCLQEPTMLTHFDEGAPTIIHMNASDAGLGIVFVQW